jgi:hypothetical protein
MAVFAAKTIATMILMGFCQLKNNLRFKVQGSGFRVQGSRFWVQGSGFWVQGSRFRVQGSRFRVQGSRFWVQGSGFSPAASQKTASQIEKETLILCYRRVGHRADRYCGHGGPPYFKKIASKFMKFHARVQGSGFKVQGSGFKVRGSGFRVQRRRRPKKRPV